MKTNEFNPDWVSAPGETIADILEERKLLPSKFALQIGRTLDYVNELIRGQKTITVETSKQLERALGTPATFWMARERQYREGIARLKLDEQEEPGVSWLAELPVKEMKTLGWISPGPDQNNILAACLSFFEVPNVRAWREASRNVLESVAFRTSPSFKSHPAALLAWLRQGEIEGSKIACEEWNVKRFTETLPTIRALTRKRNPELFIPELRRRCSECGVALVILRAPKGCRASGATRFLSGNKALLLLSFRYLSDDHFWFTFFHEAGHLVLHNKNALFLEGDGIPSSNEESEANGFAAGALIPGEFRKELHSLKNDGIEVVRFARRVGVSPGIVVGQLQHDGQINHSQLNSLKRRFQWIAN